MKIKNKPTHQGFTLVELLVVIVIVAVLAAVSFSAVVRFRKSADKTLVLGSMRQLQTANISYSSDNQGKFVSPEVEIDSITYKWFENPDLISQLKGEEATYGSSGATPDTTLPLSMMDPSVVREKSANHGNLSGSYAYTRPIGQNPLVVSQLKDASRSAAFITSDGDGFIDHATKTEIAYRHADKAIVVYYGGQAAILNEADINRIDSNGGTSNIFWSAVQ